jgi:hypothetical protein
MTITISLTDADGGGTDVLAVHDRLPRGVSPADNEAGWREALAKLAALVDAGYNTRDVPSSSLMSVGASITNPRIIK